ncbi:DUF599 domain-containing protein [Paracoccus pacificus]|uniref:DUF599 domain-containing protein n=1 Tax=Paracoccus pacificus TaxID=1463598 RepID=A0ABW4R681_9RHOB
MQGIGAIFGPFGPLDIAAVAFLFLAWLSTGWIIEHPPARHPSVSVLMKAYRREWMRQLITRQPRIFDSATQEGLRQATSFYASACMIAIGGGVALLGNTERLAGIATELELGRAPLIIYEVKIVTALFLVVTAFLKFVWAHRLFGYCAIVMAAVPNDPYDALALPRAAQAAELNITAARSFNTGLRSVYYALGALAWLIGPWMLIAAVAVVTWITLRREFLSHSRRVVLENLPLNDQRRRD